MINIIPFLDLLDTEEEKNKFEELYSKYSNLVMYICLEKLNNNFALAEECTQEVFLQIALNFKKFLSQSVAESKKHVCTIARGHAINMYKKEFNPKFHTDIDIYNDDFAFVDNSFFETVNTNELRDAINRLSEEDAVYIHLTYVYGYTSKEIGKMFNVSADSVRKHLQFSRAKLKKQLSE